MLKPEKQKIVLGCISTYSKAQFHLLQDWQGSVWATLVGYEMPLETLTYNLEVCLEHPKPDHREIKADQVAERKPFACVQFYRASRISSR